MEDEQSFWKGEVTLGGSWEETGENLTGRNVTGGEYSTDPLRWRTGPLGEGPEIR